MSERYSILRPLNSDELEKVAIAILNFFSPANYNENCSILKKVPDKNMIRPMSHGDLFHFLDERKILEFESFKYIYHVNSLIAKFVHKGILNFAGSKPEGSPPLNNCYYSNVELTELEAKSTLWLGKVLGETFLMSKLHDFIIRFEGHNSLRVSGTGSGVLIGPDVILTCKHNLTDLKKFECFLGEEKLEIESYNFHEKYDLGLVRLKTKISRHFFPHFGTPFQLDNVITMGYPPLRGMREAALITQKGEINALCTDWWGCECITISSAVRPGNSGGPVISLNGYIVGIVTQFANSASSASSDKNDFVDSSATPFYNAISSIGIMNNINAIDPSIDIKFENYQ